MPHKERDGPALFESIRWDPDVGWSLLDAHLARLRRAAHDFGYPFEEADARESLVDRGSGLAASAPEPHKVRLELAPEGTMTIEAVPMAEMALPDPVRVGLARDAIDASDPRLRYKTTDRRPYEHALAGRADCDDVLLHNGRGELTESTRANLVVRLDAELLTPPVTSGLLDGTFRRTLIERGEVRERTLTIADLRHVEAIWLVNSVRGWMDVTWVPSTAGPSTESARAGPGAYSPWPSE